MSDTYLGLSPLIWKGIFSFLNVFIVGLLLALFATKYQKRKEVEIQIEGEVLKLRLKAYERINIFFGKLYQQIAPPAYKQIAYEEFLDGFSFRYNHPEYARCFNSEKEFDDFYFGMQNVLQMEHPYLDFDVEVRLRDSLAMLTHLKLMLDAFTDIEHLNTWHFSKEVSQRHIDLAYQLTGIAMQHEVMGLYCKMDKLLAKRLRNITLSYEEPRFRKWWYQMMEHLFAYIDKWSYERSWKTKFYWILAWVFGGSRERLAGMFPYLPVMYMYVHYSEKYTRNEFDDLSEETRNKLMREFLTHFTLQFNH